MKFKYYMILSVVFVLSGVGGAYAYFSQESAEINEAQRERDIPRSTTSPTFAQSPTSQPVPASYEIPMRAHVFQSFNNCGPASLSMALSYFDIRQEQDVIGRQLRPHQIASGDNDDKSVSFAELGEYASAQHGLVYYHRPNGDIELLKQLIARDIPVLTRTWLNADEDIGHYRLVRGYDDVRGVVIQDDSYEDKDLEYSYDDFLTLWQAFGYEYLVVVPPEKQNIVEQILGEETDTQIAWENALFRARSEENKLSYSYTEFNESRALYYLGDYEESVRTYESIQSDLPGQMLWYQYEPILAYEELGNVERVFSLTNNILNNGNRAFSELYMIRGDAYLSQGNNAFARREYELALRYNENMEEAQEALEQVN